MRPGSGCRKGLATRWRSRRLTGTRSRQGSLPDPESRWFSLANGIVEPRYGRAEVAELADASVSKTDVRKDVRVRLPISAPRCSRHSVRGPLQPVQFRWVGDGR